MCLKHFYIISLSFWLLYPAGISVVHRYVKFMNVCIVLNESQCRTNQRQPTSHSWNSDADGFHRNMYAYKPLLHIHDRLYDFHTKILCRFRLCAYLRVLIEIIESSSCIADSLRQWVISVIAKICSSCSGGQCLKTLNHFHHRKTLSSCLAR